MTALTYTTAMSVKLEFSVFVGQLNSFIVCWDKHHNKVYCFCWYRLTCFSALSKYFILFVVTYRIFFVPRF